MLGVLAQYLLDYDSAQGKLRLSEVWRGKTETIDNVNALIVDDKRIIAGGFDVGERG